MNFKTMVDKVGNFITEKELKSKTTCDPAEGNSSTVMALQTTLVYNKNSRLSL